MRGLKRELRRSLAARRDSVLPAQKKEWDSSMANRLLASEEYRRAGQILAFASFRSEIATEPILRRAWEDGKRVFLPISLPSGKMAFYAVSSFGELQSGAYGIREPIPEEHKKLREKTGLCLVPGLSFDRCGFRLGYGGGYYDRFLREFEGVSLGLCYGCLLEERLPSEPFDRPVNGVITENEWIRIKP